MSDDEVNEKTGLGIIGWDRVEMKRNGARSVQDDYCVKAQLLLH